MDFVTREEATSALERLHNHSLLGYRLVVCYAGIRSVEGPVSTGTAKGTNLEAWEDDLLEQKVTEQKYRHLTRWGPPDEAIGSREVELKDRRGQRQHPWELSYDCLDLNCNRGPSFILANRSSI